MIHFPSSLHAGSSSVLPTRTDSLKLNATQQKAPTHKILLTIEEELHDARRVHSHGQEEDLRLALNMLIERLSHVSTMLSDAYKTNADLEVHLNVTKSNLTLITANNEMLEEALKQRDGTAQNLGWRRTSGRAHSTDDVTQASGGDRTPTSAVEFPAVQENSRFFKFRFAQGSSSSSNSTSLPGTPGASPAMPAGNLNSPSMPALGMVGVKDREREMQLEKELEKERKACEAARKAKQALEAELESLSQALFEEANRMVATERIRLADIEEELREAKLEKEALRSALRLLEGHAASPAIPSTTASSTYASASTSPNLTLSPTSTTDAVPFLSSASSTLPSTSPPSQPVPPSLSTTTSRTTIRPPSVSLSTTIRPSLLPPPAPVDVPTTPFDYDAMYAGTPTPRPQAEVALTELDGDASAKGTRTPAAAAASNAATNTDLEVTAGERVRVSSADAQEPIVSEVEAQVDGGNEVKGDALRIQSRDEEKRRPMELNLSRAHTLGLEHEPDPWADAPSASV